MEYEVVFRTLDVERWGFSGPVSFAARGIVEAAMQAKQWAHDASKGGTSKGPFYTVHAIRDTYLDRSADVRYIELARVAAKPITELARSLAPSCFPPTHHVVATMLARELNNALHRKADGAYRAGFSDAACGAIAALCSILREIEVPQAHRPELLRQLRELLAIPPRDDLCQGVPDPHWNLRFTIKTLEKSGCI